MKRLLSFLVVILISTIAFAQSVTLTFTAKDAANQHVQLHRVSITNLTKGWQETIYWPDTTLTMQNGTGISDIVGANDYSPLRLSQNNPNPFTGTTEVNLMVTNEGTVALDIADINGRIVVANDYTLQPGPQVKNVGGVASSDFSVVVTTDDAYVTMLQSILSSTADIAIDAKTCFAGELGLNGEVRPVTRIEQRIMEANKLGFTRMFVSKYNLKGVKLSGLKIKILPISRVEEMLSLLFQE